MVHQYYLFLCHLVCYLLAICVSVYRPILVLFCVEIGNRKKDEASLSPKCSITDHSKSVSLLWFFGAACCYVHVYMVLAILSPL